MPKIEDCGCEEGDLFEVFAVPLTEGGRKQIVVAEGTTLKEALDAMGVEYGPNSRFYIDGLAFDLEEGVFDGDTIQVITPSAEKE